MHDKAAAGFQSSRRIFKQTLAHRIHPSWTGSPTITLSSWRCPVGRCWGGKSLFHLEEIGKAMDYSDYFLLRLWHLTLGACCGHARATCLELPGLKLQAGLMRIQRCNIEDEGVTRPCTCAPGSEGPQYRARESRSWASGGFGQRELR